jgi:ribosome biogenesis protein MAK21
MGVIEVYYNFLLSGEAIKYPGDPLQDFSLPKFLDRFVFKNPKKNIKEKVIKFSRKKAYIPAGIRSLRVDSASYLNEDECRIPVDELFLYRLV